MGMLWPGSLLLLGLIPIVTAIYIWMLRRRRRYVVRFSSLALLREALPHQSRWRRHLPFALFLLALASLVIALGRPVSIVRVPAGRTTIIMAIDVSRSMCSTDIPPNRLEAAKSAAKSFVQRQSASTQIGIVAFAGFAELIQPPTTDQEVLQDAIAGLTTARRTAIGSAILKSLDAISEINPNVAPSTAGFASEGNFDPAPSGVYAPDIIVLLTDGRSNAGPPAVEAAIQAAERGIRVYTIGFGTQNDFGYVMDCFDQYWSGGTLGGGQFGGSMGGGIYSRFDEPALKEIADITGGSYHSAASAGELHNVFRELPTSFITREETLEISVAFAAIGALLAALAFMFSMIWQPLI